MAGPRLGPVGWRGDVPDGNGDDGIGIPDREVILGKVLAHPDHRILVSLVVVRPDVDVAGRRIQSQALQLADDRVVVRPAADKLVGALDGVLEQVERRVAAVRLEARILVPALVIALHERSVDRPLVARRIEEVIVGVDPGQNALGMILADGMRDPAEGQGRGHLHLVEQAITQGLLVERHVIAAPQAADKQVRLGREQLRDVRREVGREQLGPGFGDSFGPRHEALEPQHEVFVHVPAVAVVRLDGGDRARLRPRLRRADRGRKAVRRLNVRDPEDVVWIGHGLVEQEVRAAVVEQGQDPEFLGDQTEGGGIAAGDDAGEEIDALRQLHAPEFLDVGVGSGGLVGGDRLDLALAQEPTFGVDFLGGQEVSLQTRLAQRRGGARLERDMAGFEGFVRDISFGLRRGRSRPWCRHVTRRPHRRGEAGGPDGHAGEKIAASDFHFLLVHECPPLPNSGAPCFGGRNLTRQDHPE